MGQAAPVYEVYPHTMTNLRGFVREVIGAKHETSGARYNWDGETRRFERNLEGYLGEFVACYHYGLDFEWEVMPGRGDGNHDIRVGDHLLGVKTTSYTNGRLLIKRKEAHKDGCPGHFLLCYCNVTVGTVRLVGVAPRKLVMDREPRRMRDDGPLNYVVEPHELRAARDSYAA